MKRTGVFLAACGILWGAGGCGGDDGPTGPGNGGALSVSLRDGTWAVTSSTYSLGSSSECDTDTMVVADEQVLCGATLETVLGYEDVSTEGMNCSVGGDGSTFTLECSGTLAQDPCIITFEITGGGSGSETSFSMYMDFVIGATGPADPCLGFDLPCTMRIEMSGTWVSADGACGPQASPGVTVPTSMLDRILARE